MRDSDGRAAVLCAARGLVPALLAELGRRTTDSPASLLAALADTVRLLPQLDSAVESLLVGVSRPPWPGRTDPPAAERRSKKPRLDEGPVRRDLLAALLPLVQRFPERLRQLWDWSGCLPLLQDPDPETRWLAARILALISGMGPGQTERLAAASGVTGEDEIRLTARHLNPTPMVTPPAAGGRSSSPDRDVMVTSPAPLLTSEDISGQLVCVEGVTLPVVDAAAACAGPLVLVPDTRAALRSLALAVAAGRPALLQGPVGSGKTSLVHHLAAVTGHVGYPRLVSVQLGDQTDSKLLLGSYRCTEVPGEFVWQPGCLAQAVTDGSWLLMEDIDRAPMDVVSLLVPLLESRCLTVPGHGDLVRAAPGFQLFATQRLLPGAGGALHKQQTSHAALLDRLWLRVAVQPLSGRQLSEAMVHRWPRLNTVASRLLEVYAVMASVRDDSEEATVAAERAETARLQMKEARLVSTRDLMKWCQRAGDDFDVTSAQCASRMFQDAADIFCAAVARRELRLPLAQEIGARLGLLSAQVEFSVTSHKPSVTETAEVLTVGRARLPVARSAGRPAVTFSFTRQACVLLERVGVAVGCREPVLLVGETGVGKTSSVQYLAERTGRRLVVINMNQQSDSADLLGGYKPVDMKQVMAPLRDEFETLFRETFDAASNEKFLRNIMTLFAAGRWKDLTALMRHVHGQAPSRLRRRGLPPDHRLWTGWHAVGQRLQSLKDKGQRQLALAFAFIEGTLVKAVREGHWVLLDEINLASAETLECLSGLLESPDGPLTLLERGDVQTVPRHPDFRLFACMNPATDVGKRDLPAGLRNRFTELFVDELEDAADLRVLTADYLRHLGVTGAQVSGVVSFYQRVRAAAANQLQDGTGHRPHYSLRTLCRALRVAAGNPCGGVPRSLYEALCLSFLTQLDRASYPTVTGLIQSLVLGGKSKAQLSQPIPAPSRGQCVQFEGYWVRQGQLEPRAPEHYVLTPSVKENLRDLARAVSLGGLPVLLQGETSVGKTSLISYLAAASGNRCVRINNHEHTDLQEYVGAYGADETGKLVFKEGALVEAMRRGHWIILDELNLAPSDVLEALNRVLDDNRELFIAETQTVVRAHPRFMLFATQNPPGQYGGRKMLSRAFRNRFIELHFDDIPAAELETILHQRCRVPANYCKKMVAVLLELQTRRRGSSVFQGKQGFITLRDLFRWAERYRQAGDQTTRFYDWDQHVADEGYLVLAGRVRRDEECQVIATVLQKHFKRTVTPENLFSLHAATSPVTRPVLEQLLSEGEGGTAHLPAFRHLVWTQSTRRLAVLLCQALKFQEPVLLVGDTGCGKTTVCQLLAETAGRSLHTVNCHMHTEGADFLGGLRPVRSRAEPRSDAAAGDGNGEVSGEDPASGGGGLFEWVDGPLVVAMRNGHYFLADEISLADDSVLERLNSVLEPERTLLLAERSGGDGADLVTAETPFRFVATMNPGGDYGKKELSPALRNRFTEIWCAQSRCREDLVDIIKHNLISRGESAALADAMMDFIEWFSSSDAGRKVTVSIRDILAWVNFVNTVAATGVPLPQAYIHGACLVFLDGLGSGQPSSAAGALRNARAHCLHVLSDQMSKLCRDPGVTVAAKLGKLINTDSRFGFEPFLITKGSAATVGSLEGVFSLTAATPAENASRLLRALQLTKPILLEGSPGVGKTSLVAALARVSGHKLTRINLSDQTDVSDLFGADLPVEGGQGGQFAWRDGPLLQALRAGHWVVLDELNLASQSVLEGLNACLDHRGSVYIPELGREFHLQPGVTRIFACQNPLHEGGARKGLPKSFLNRFTQVYVEPLTPADLKQIAATSRLPGGGLCPPSADLAKMCEFSRRMDAAVNSRREFGQRGGPWEFNLRDLTRWCELLSADAAVEDGGRAAGHHVQLLYADRMRSAADKAAVLRLSEEVFGEKYERPPCYLTVTREALTVGGARLERAAEQSHVFSAADLELQIVRRQLPVMESLVTCINRNWMAVLVGPPESGKTSVARALAALSGHRLRVLTMNSAMDTTELLGGFEQADLRRHLEQALQELEELLWCEVRAHLLDGRQPAAAARCGQLLAGWQEVRRATAPPAAAGLTPAEEAEHLAVACAAAGRLLELVSSERAGPLAARLAALHAAALADSSVNAGGKFEWVDSVLVRALRAGDWLLVDNVNFCPASVLDRLNALLEPGGVLEVSERGVVDGAVPTVRPHPSFRLLLAMDPRHGEISRAMRNRGVEIYMLGPEETGGALSPLDVSALLVRAGLSEARLQRRALRLHEAVRQRAPGAERPGLLALLSCADLVGQMVARGLDETEALREAALDTYVRPLLSGAARRQLTPLIQELVAEAPPPARLPRPALACAPVPLYWMDAELARARQLWSAVEQLLPGPPAARPLLHAFRHALEAIAPRGLRLVTLAASQSGDQSLQRLAAVDAATLLASEADKNRPAVCLLLLAKLEAALYEETDQQLQDRLTKSSQWKRASLYALSVAAEKGLVTVGALPHPAVALLAPLLRALDAALSSGLTAQPGPAAAMVFRCRAALPWRRRLRALCDRRPPADGLTDWLAQLALHWRWTTHHLLPELRRMDPNTDGQTQPAAAALADLCARVDALIGAEVSPPVLFAARVTEAVQRPPPFADPEAAALVVGLTRVAWALDPYLSPRPADARRVDNPTRLVELLTSAEGVRARRALTEAVWMTLSQDTHTETAAVALRSAEELLGRRGLLRVTAELIVELEEEEPMEQDGEKDDDEPVSGPAVPLLEALLRYKEAPLVLDAFCRNSAVSDKATKQITTKFDYTDKLYQDPDSFAAELSQLSARSPLYIGLWRAAVGSDSPPSLQARLRSSLLAAYLQTAASDPGHSLWVAKPPPEDDGEEQRPAELQKLHPRLYCADATHVIAADLCKPDDESLLDSVAIGDVSHRCREMEALRRLLWRNATDMSDVRFCSLHAHHRLALAVWERFSKALLAAGRLPDDVTSSLIDVINSLAASGQLSAEQAAWLTTTAEIAARSAEADVPTAVGTGELFARVGGAQLAVLGQLMAVDPVEERRLLLEYCDDEAEDVQEDLSAAGLALRLVSGVELEDLPERHVPESVLQQRQRLAALRRQRAELDGGAACRPTPPTYHQLKQDLRNFLSSAGSLSALEDRQLRTLLTSYSSFLAGLEARHGWYRDLTAPLLAAGRQTEFGLRVLLGCGERRAQAARLPVLLWPLQPTLLELADWLRPAPVKLHCPRVAALLDTLRDDTKPHLVADWKIRVLMLICRELTAQLALTGDVSASEVGALLREARLLWQAQQQRRRDREQQKDSIYTTKTHCQVNDMDEEAETARQVAEMFPDYSDAYADLKPPGLDDPVPIGGADATAGTASRDEPELTPGQLAELWQLHRQAYGVCAAARWLPEPPSDAAPADLVRPFCERYRLFSALCASLSPQLEAAADGQLAPSHLVAAAVLEAGTAPEAAPLAPPPPQKPYDVYRDPHVSEVASCRSVLRRLDGRCEELLASWPDHPALVALRRCVGRVLQQPVTAPLVKVVTGLERVLECAQDWEQNAHRGVSLSTQLEEVTDLVLRWRKLELDCWKRCLDSAAYECHMAASRWLPHLLALVEDGSQTVAEMTAPLQQFVESSPLGEFPARLQMLLSVHRQMVCHGAAAAGKRGGGPREQLSALLWNLYQYYSQFYPVVEKHLRGLRKPIEQKVKDFVKIARWNDVNFWSVKDTVKKSHRMVHKHVKEFQAVLAQPVSAALLDVESIDDEAPSDTVGAWDREQAAPPAVTVTPELYIARGRVAPVDSPYPAEQRLTRLRQLYLRSRRLCRSLYTQSPLMEDIAALNDVTSCVCQTADKLSRLNVDGVTDKERRKKQIGFQRQRKRQAVVELYRTLNRLGVSYRRGLITWEQESADFRLLLTPPVDVTGGDGRLSAAWRGCLKYECRAVSRLALMRRALLQPHRELGPQNLERIRGVSADLMTQLCAARQALSELEGAVSRLSALLQEVSGLSCQPQPDAHAAAQRRYRRAEAHLLAVSELYLKLLPRLRLYLLAAPDGQPTAAAGSLRLSAGTESDLRSRGRAAPEHGRLLGQLDVALAASRAARGRLRRAGARRWNSPLLWTRDDASRLEEARAELGQAAGVMTELRTALGGTEADPVVAALRSAEQKLSEPDSPQSMEDASDDGGEAAEQRLVAAARRVSGQVLLAVQRLYRTQEERQQQEQPEEAEDAQVGLFSERVQRRLLAAAEQLDAGRVVCTLTSLVARLTEAPLDRERSGRVITLLSQLVPLLNQYQHLCTFVLVHQMTAYRASAKLLSVLLKLFTVMAQKGFCTPEDMQDEGEDSEAGTEFKELEDGGLGEGQGAKDVSDKLESEDQLEGAYKPGEEPEPADDDVKEEENGVEMSDDFSGRMQDVERKEGDDDKDESDDEDEEEPDKQMGEVDGEDQERLDEKLWGSDDEDDDQPTPEDDEPQDGGHGREDAQLAAKEDDGPEERDDSKKEQRQRQDMKENEMEEDEDQQADPYHNNFAPEAEPEELDIPEREGADSERGSESDTDGEEPEENPWDIEQKADFPDEGEDKEQDAEQEQDSGEQQPEPTNAPEEASEDENDKADEEGEEKKGTSDERADGDEPEPDEQETAEREEQEASQLDASEQAGEAAQEEAARGTQDRLQQPQQVAAEDRPEEQSASAERTDEKAAVGMAESSESGHQAADAAQLSRPEPSRREKQERAQQRRPGQSDSKRSLGTDNQPVEKRLKTVDADSTEDAAAEEEKGERGEKPKQSDLYQHIQDAEKEDALAADAATREQALERPVPADVDEDAPEPEDDVQMQEDGEGEKDEDAEQPEKLQPIRPEKLTDRQSGGRPKNEEGDEEAAGGPERGEVDGEAVLTASAQRPVENSAHTALDQLDEDESAAEPPPPDLGAAASAEAEAEAERAWQQYETVIGPLAQELCEQLRLILEPTQTAKLMGDYRTGKRLNMRKVIPYIASQFRKDKIWLRRTKPSKRDYQVAIAVDDSSSMSDSQSRQLAFEALALVSRALALLEVGQLAVLSFGESTRLLHGLHEPLGAAAGAQLLRRFTFAQSQTRVAAMLDSVTALLSGGGGRRAARLLLVVSDGRGLFHEGQETVRRAVRRARLAGIFLVLLIVDSPDSNSSVLDIRMPRFGPDGRLLGIRPYLDSFPFPFYVILRDIGALPAVLSDALRQWFELVTAADR
ncbi:Midasin [Amphibalanus amphitrite]|uniref:Midasin n=1 Tax=Amphibalanus amphitrite TaxID=1232801 RepID=A0A6A4W7P4_AMPAM|nr:Midasin [Amphibalanus amphitrite]